MKENPHSFSSQKNKFEKSLPTAMLAILICSISKIKFIGYRLATGVMSPSHSKVMPISDLKICTPWCDCTSVLDGKLYLES